MSPGADAGERDPTRTGAFVAFGLAGLLAALVIAGAWPDVVDDAFITFRASENAARGAGLTFDPGEPPVESFSNPLLALLLVPTAALGLPSIWIARLLGLLGLALSVVGAGRIVRLAGGSARSAILAGAASLGSFALVFYAWVGLETTLYAGLLTSAVWRWLHLGQRLDPILGAIFVAVALSRPEAPLVLVLFAPLLVRDPDRRRAVGIATAVAVLLGALLALRFHVYGSLVPNTFYAKAAGSADHDPSTSPVAASLGHLASFAISMGLALPLLAVAAPFARRSPVLAVAAPVVAVAVFALYAGGDWMPGARYLAPASPLVAALGALGLDRLARDGTIARPNLTTGLALAASLAGSADLLATATIHRREFPYHVLSSVELVDAARDMRTLLPPRARVVAFRIGALGWAGDFEVIDLLGLADRTIARVASAHPGYHPQRTRMGEDVPEIRDYVASRDPDAVLLVTDADATFDPSIELYGRRFEFARSYPLGVDQAWALYRRPAADAR